MNAHLRIPPTTSKASRYSNRHTKHRGVYGADDTRPLGFLTSCVNAMVKSDQQMEAIAMLEGRMPAWNKKIPRSSPDTIEILQPLGRASVEMGRFEDAPRSE